MSLIWKVANVCSNIFQIIVLATYWLTGYLKILRHVHYVISVLLREFRIFYNNKLCFVYKLLYVTLALISRKTPWFEFVAWMTVTRNTYIISKADILESENLKDHNNKMKQTSFWTLSSSPDLNLDRCPESNLQQQRTIVLDVQN